MAERLFVTRQAVSRWERGETIPEVETLQALSRLFGVSINTLLGSPRTLVCQSCGMPLNDDILAKNTDGSFNEQYCMWCWDGAFSRRQNAGHRWLFTGKLYRRKPRGTSPDPGLLFFRREIYC